MKFLKGVSFLVVVLFLSSCKQSFLSSKYNHLEKVERVSSSSTEQKNYSIRPLLKKNTDSSFVKLASVDILEDTLITLTASIDNKIQLSSALQIQPFIQKLSPTDSLSARKKPLIFRKYKDLTEAEKTNNRTKAYIFLIGGFLLLCLSFLVLYTVFNLFTLGVVLFFISLIALFTGLIYTAYAKNSILMTIVFTLIAVATFFVSGWCLFIMLLHGAEF